MDRNQFADHRGRAEFAERGTERDDLVKINGHGLFKPRVITSNAGRQAMFRKAN